MIFGTNFSGAENGTETFSSPAGANIEYYSSYTGGDASQGPTRCGIEATGITTSRKLTGAGFYGAMNLSGNVVEYYVCVNAGITGNFSATGLSEGTGILDPNTGNHNIANWPPYYCVGSSCTQPYTYVIRRGGSFSDGGQYYTTCCSPTVYLAYYQTSTCVSNRYQQGNYYSISADSQSGGRGGR